MKRSIIAAATAVALSLTISAFALAQHSHGSSAAGSPMKMDTLEVLVEGVKISFQIMANDAHRTMLKDMKMKDDVEAGTTHNVAVVLTDQITQAEITDAKVSMKVIDPSGKDQIKTLKYEDMMKSHDGYFNMPEKGKYQILVLARFAERKITAGVHYDLP